MQHKLTHSPSIEETLILENRYESVETPCLISSQLEEKINAFLDSQNVQITDPKEKINNFFKKNKFFIFKNQESKSLVSMGSINEETLENLPTNMTINPEEAMKSSTTLGSKSYSMLESQEMILKGVESFKLLKRRKDEPKSEIFKEEEEKKE